MFIINWGYVTSRLDATSFRKISVFDSKIFKMCELDKLVAINPPVSFSKLADDDEISFIPMERIDENFGIVKAVETRKRVENKGFTKFQEGDLLWAKITPCMQNGKSAIAENLVNGFGCGSTEFFVIRQKTSNILIKYIHFILRDERILRNAQNFFGGSAGQQRVSKDFLRKLPIPVPPKAVQQQIINILDEAYETKRQKEQQSNDLLNRINSYLLEELGTTMPQEEENTLKSRVFFTDSKKVLGSRFDPKKYMHRYQKIFAAIENSPFDKKSLREIILYDVSGNWGLDETEIGIELVSCLTIRATEFDNKFNLNLENNRTKYRKYKPQVYEKIALSSNEILVEKSGGSEDQPVGRVAFVEKDMVENNNLAYSNFIHKLIVDESKVHSRYLFEYLRLMHNIKAIEVMQTQTNGIRNLIMREYFGQTVVVPDKNIQKRIADEASKMRMHAKKLETEADNIIKDAKAQIEKILLEGNL